MMRLPWFRYHAPRTLGEAARILAGEGPNAMAIAGGTDLLPNMKRRHQVPATLVSLRGVDALKTVRNGSGLDGLPSRQDRARGSPLGRPGGLTLGAGLTLAEVVDSPLVRAGYDALRQAAAQVATPQLRNMGTLGGNLCLDTRCNYYNQNYEWRKAIDFCLKKDGGTCWVATASKRCVAVSSTDCAPALIALDAKVKLVSAAGEREVAAADLYLNDGIDYLARKPDEILTEVRLPGTAGWKSCYWKLRRRGAFDFPVLGVAAAVRTAPDGTVEDARIVLGAVASRPVLTKGGEALVGKRLTDEAIAEAGTKVASRAKPLDNADLDIYWRKEVVASFVGYALREIRGDDMRAVRLRIARHAV
jgi:4-hydroxybenzoyl-CoA reductase subunit beta